METPPDLCPECDSVLVASSPVGKTYKCKAWFGRDGASKRTWLCELGGMSRWLRRNGINL